MTIKIYSTPACTYCKMAKDFLTTQNVSYVDVDVSVDATAREEMVEKSGQLGVPVFDIDGQIMVGYNQQLLSKVIGIGTAGAAPAPAPVVTATATAAVASAIDATVDVVADADAEVKGEIEKDETEEKADAKN